MRAMTAIEQGYYVFGLVLGQSSLPQLTGFEGKFLEVVAEVGGIGAVGCAVSLDEFGQDEVARRMSDIDWVSQVATRHYGLCEQLYQQTENFLPFRLCTVFSGSEPVEQLLKERQVELTTEFERLGGKAEFGLKIWGREEWLSYYTITQDAHLQALQTTANQGGGKAFFARKQFEQALSEAKKRLLPQLGRRLATAISKAMSLNVSEVKVLGQLANSHEGYVAVINLSLLLEKTQADQLQKLAERLDREALEGGLIEVIGPLPPYSFISLGQEAV